MMIELGEKNQSINQNILVFDRVVVLEINVLIQHPRDCIDAYRIEGYFVDIDGMIQDGWI